MVACSGVGMSVTWGRVKVSFPVLGPIDDVVEVRVHRSGHHGSAVVRTRSGTVAHLEAGWEASAPATQMSVTGGTTTLTATEGQLLAGSIVVATGRPPDAGDAPRAWLDALAGRPHQPLTCQPTLMIVKRLAAVLARAARSWGSLVRISSPFAATSITAASMTSTVAAAPSSCPTRRAAG